MEKNLCVLLYSKYSQHSKNFMDLLQQSPIDFTTLVGLNPLCIDNENIRKRIISSSKLNIDIVPCILLIYPDGGVEKYAGITAFNWAEDIIRQNIPSLPPQPPPVIKPVQLSTKNVKKQKDDDEEEEEEEEYTSPPPRKTRGKKQISKAPPVIAKTNIEDLNSEEEDEDYLERPPASIRAGAGNYDVKGQFGEQEEPNRTVSRGIKASTEQGVGGKGNLMATAQAMQKSREQTDSTRHQGGMPPDRI